jgi:integrase
MAIGKLTHAKIAKLNKKALLGDGGGLWLRARLLKDTSLSKRFCFRYRKRGIYAEIPIGPFPEVSLVDARLKASGYRAAIANGEDPAADRRAAKGKAASIAPGAMTFKQWTLDYAELMRAEWRSADTYDDWLRAFVLYLFTLIGDLPITEIDDARARAALAPLFKKSPALGWRTASRCKAVFDRARALNATTTANPFEKRVLRYVFPARAAAVHMRTIPYAEMPDLFRGLVERGDDLVALAARFLIALALRPGEARYARFEMINFETSILTLPTTKNGKPFIAPLSAAALAVIERCRAIRSGDWLFPGARQRGPIHETAILELIRELTGGATAHGVARSCFSDWAYETDAGSDSVIEACLNHVTPGGGTVRAYKRGSQLELRARLMERYSDFLTAASGVVVAFPLIRSS